MKSLSVLVVEDDSMIGLLLAETLKDMGHAVCAIECTEADAIAAAARYRPDLMIVDVWLRDGNGISAVEQIFRMGPVPYVFVSGDTARIRVMRPGAVVMAKPYRRADLDRAIRRVIADVPPN